MKLSVIVATSPGREVYLDYCLKALCHQSFQNFEVLICDDGSAGMQSICQSFRHQLTLSYDWRPNDRNLSRSRNRGAARAEGEGLIFLNGDVLLNPEALQAYHDNLLLYPQATLWGYVGCRKAVRAPSYWFPEVQVNWLDFRFFPLSDQEVYIHNALQQAPYRLAGGHHFALLRQTFDSIGLLNESFQEWGDEDIEYALRSLNKGFAMHFVGDAWGEHLDHPYQERFHLEAPSQQSLKARILATWQQQLKGPLPPSQLLFSRQLATLHQRIQTHYLLFQPDAIQTEILRRQLSF